MALSVALPRRDFPRTIPEALLNFDPRDVPHVVQALQTKIPVNVYDEFKHQLPGDPTLLQFMDWLLVWDLDPTSPPRDTDYQPPTIANTPEIPTVEEQQHISENPTVQESSERIPKPRKGWLMVPHTFLCNNPLPARERLLYLMLLSHQGQNAEAWPSQETLATQCGCSIRTIKKMVDRLVKDGYLKVRRLGRRKANRYTVMRKFCVSHNHRPNGLNE